MSSFRQLSKGQLREIVVAFHGGETKASIARRYEVDRSTIHYHLKKFEQTYPEEGDVYSYVKVDLKKVCKHPSHRCTLCGTMWDKIERKELSKIGKLRVLLDEANARLRVAGLYVEPVIYTRRHDT